MTAFELYSYYDFLWFFVIYAFLGWCTEVAYAAVCHGRFVNRGFLNGPVCPIYGFGVTLVIAVLTPLADSGLLLFAGSVLLTSALEWVTGFILEKVFRNKWWDYSDVPFNLNGYICLKFSIIWGLACTFIVDVFHPTVTAVVQWIPPFAGGLLVAALLAVFAADAGITAASILKMNKRLEQMDEIASMLRETSERLGETISDNVVELMEKTEDVKEELRERRDDLAEELRFQKDELEDSLEELKERYEELVASRRAIHNRLLKAFPGMKPHGHREAFEALKKRWSEKNDG